jgi:hypothetical protein
MALAAGASQARADHTGWLSIPASTFGPTQTDWPAVNLALPQFNPNLGILTEVDLRLDYKFDNTLTAQFVTMATINVNAMGAMGVVVPGGSGSSHLLTASFTSSGSHDSTPSDIMSGNPVPLGHKVVTGTTPVLTFKENDSTTLAMFKGTGQVMLPAAATALSNFTTTSGNGFGSSLTLATATVEVMYTYIAVPEPSSVVLTGLGVTGLVLAGCRRAARSKSEALRSVV